MEFAGLSDIGCLRTSNQDRWGAHLDEEAEQSRKWEWWCRWAIVRAACPGPRMMPQGSMRMLDPITNAWTDVPYDREGTGMDYIYQTLVPPFQLKHGETITYQLEMQINAQQNFTVGAGNGAINVTRTDVTTHSAIGTSPTASLRISVEP
jgi:hypothetical protein